MLVSKIFLAFAVFLMAFSPSASFAAALPAPRIESVKAVIGGGDVPKSVKRRMESTVEAVGGQLFLGLPVAAARHNLKTNAAVIGTVFDKVLVGYTVTDASCAIINTDDGLAVEPSDILNGDNKGAKFAVLVKIDLTPWDDVIAGVKMDVAVEGFSDGMAALARQDLAAVGTVFEEAFFGLPLAAADWANGVVKKRLKDYLAERLPEFRADYDVAFTPEKTAAVTLVVYPRLPVVRSIDLSMRSDTLPNSLLLNFREKFKKKVAELNGVPVDFVMRHKDDLAKYLAQSLDEEPFLHKLAAKTAVTLTGGEYLAVMSRTDTKKADIRLTGWTDVGHSSAKHSSRRDTVGMLHVGFLPYPYDEIFTQIEVYPADAAAKLSFGWYHAIDKSGRFWSDLRYDASEKDFVYGAYWDINKRVRLRYEYRKADSLGETAVRFKLHDFLGLEYAVDKDDNWLRVIGYF